MGGEEKNWVANVIPLGCIGFVVWIFERLVGHLVARPGHSSHAISVPGGSGPGYGLLLREVNVNWLL